MDNSLSVRVSRRVYIDRTGKTPTHGTGPHGFPVLGGGHSGAEMHIIVGQTFAEPTYSDSSVTVCQCDSDSSVTV